MTVAYLPAEERREIIRQYAKSLDIKTFIETGTADGGTVAALLDTFETIITIELDDYLFTKALTRFAINKNVVCVNGDSGQWLTEFMKIKPIEPIIFWLDGHYCGGARGDIDTPIRAELLAAVKAPAGSVILIDDARLFGEMPEHTEEFKDYPTITWVQQIAKAHGFNWELQDDIMRLTPTS